MLVQRFEPQEGGGGASQISIIMIIIYVYMRNSSKETTVMCGETLQRTAMESLHSVKELSVRSVIQSKTLCTSGWLKCCPTSTETVGLLGTGAQDGHLDFHTAPELCRSS